LTESIENIFNIYDLIVLMILARYDKLQYNFWGVSVKLKNICLIRRRELCPFFWTEGVLVRPYSVISITYGLDEIKKN
jgi:hypothetical protein